MIYSRWRTASVPPTLENQQDVNFDVCFAKNAKGESIVVGDCKGEHENDRVVTLSSPKLLKELGRAKRLNVDCTFKSAPLPNWAAVLIVFALLGGNQEVDTPRTRTISPPSQRLGDL